MSVSDRLPYTFQTEGGIGTNKLILLRHRVRCDLKLSCTSTVRGGRNGIGEPLLEASANASLVSI